MFEEKTLRALRWITGLLNAKDIPYQISGGAAARIYGSSRPVNDIDIDIPENRFKDLMEEIMPYAISPFGRHRSGKWDVEIITLDYFGQELDICGGGTAKISNKDRTEWIEIPVDFSSARIITIEDMKISVIPPEKLIAYKKHLDGDHQILDIEATQRYIRES